MFIPNQISFMDHLSDLHNIDPTELDSLYKKYLSDPDSVDPGWKLFFMGYELARLNYTEESPVLQQPQLSDEFKVINLINAYRERGHYFTKTNPVRIRRKYLPTLDIENFGLTKDHLQKSFFAGNEIGIGKATLETIIETLEKTYCQALGVEFMYIRKTEIVSWLKEKMEGNKNTPSFSKDEKINLLKKIADAVNFEKFIHVKFPGQKSFSLEGAEALIPALHAVIKKGALLNYEEFVIGMPHRGRLNVLANILHKSKDEIFSEFEGKPFNDETFLGDVKYHLGYSSDFINKDGKKVHLTLAPNPSHLEAVDPVVEGIVRAKNELNYHGAFNKVVSILIHGDASVSGQGIVYEVLQMSELNGYKTGGTIHLVVNNQLGFTTNYIDGRSGVYCTVVAKILHTPIFHVNGDDIEEVVYAILLAMDYREVFHKDVFIDILCYRKYGHNESDEPRYTQPLLYKTIEKHPDPLKIYSEKLQIEGVLTSEELREHVKSFNDILETDFVLSKQKTSAVITPFLRSFWKGFKKATSNDFNTLTKTAVDKEILFEIGKKITELPSGKSFFHKIVKLQNSRLDMLTVTDNIDWGMCELLAYGTLLMQGFPVRLSGQDVKRGTFSHRHAVLTVEDSEEEYTPLKNIGDGQADFKIYNSPLSEYGVMGFEYGYALAAPNALTIWEAQFGDFFNGAQIIIDQFLSSAEEKWNVFNGLVIYLPHGYEGQGPEHSSGRIERFLELCAGNNWQIANCSTPANFFHILRRQMLREFRKPLVLFTPKSLLRHPKCVSSINDLCNGSFKTVIDDENADKTAVTKIIFCTGKIYYDLVEERFRNAGNDAALIRIEQLYPFPHNELETILKPYTKIKNYYWVQEEPANMGAATFVKKKLKSLPLMIIARPESGSPATGSSQTHKQSQLKLLEKTFGKCTCEQKYIECNMSCISD